MSNTIVFHGISDRKRDPIEVVEGGEKLNH
jgi:hypothetical protein